MPSIDSPPGIATAAAERRRNRLPGNVILPAMYMRFFGLKQQPFSLAPDPRYLYMSKRHREALAHLLYGVGGGGGFVLLSGEIGAGKTTVCRCFLEQIPKRCNVAYIFNPKLTVMELLKTICDEFHVPVAPADAPTPTVKTYVDALNGFLLQTHAVGQNNVLIIDEAQMLSAEVLEQLRLLTNLETNERKLLQIVLIGQPELRTMLERPELEQLAQRVIARFHLNALSAKETEHYIRHRLSVAGMTRAIPFDRAALLRIHEIARGVPRRINLLCDRVMLGAYAHGRHSIDVAMIEKAAREVFGRSEPSVPDRSKIGRGAGVGLVAATTLALAALIAFAAYSGWQRLGAPAAAGLAASSAPASATLAARSTPAAGRGSASATASAVAASAATANGALVSTAPLAAAANVAAGTAPTAGASASGSALTVLDTAELKAQLAMIEQDDRLAWRELVPLWGIDPGTLDPCMAAARQQVRCSKFVSTLPLLKNLARPGVVGLRDANGRTVSVVLVGLGPTTATVHAGAQTLVARTSAFANVWRGDFGTLWRVPPGYVTAIGPGASGPAVDRLATQLALLDKQPAPETPQTMDAALRERVVRFQAAHGLGSVGRAGPTTFMQLNRVTGVDEPRLAGDAAAP
jgi:general secretion pathway protein A